jgi:hypothetical protein
MTSLQLNYFVARERELQVALRAERVRQSRTARPAEARSPLGRLLSGLFARSEQRELALTPGGVERVPIAGGCLEGE